ncbi:hypothetical protein JYU34_017093 [Plutella xylostella]|uniref:Uncharacterized protein n=1 Tax=Plutella xylostella TaxID=51655 RepID=A0ABQ7Q0F1_PLUXY|nr:hypothetical protein JYU34_017093 [Plutella xylostella]
MTKLNMTLKCNDKIIENTTSTTFLGIIMDELCTWLPHIVKVCNKLDRFVYALHRLKKTADKSTALTAYHGYVASVLRYGLILWGNARDINRVFIVQKRCIRAICSAAPRDTCKPLFQNLNILSLPSLYIYEMACFAHKHRTLFTWYDDIKKNSRHPNKIVYPPCRTTFCQRSCYRMLIKIYNKLPAPLKSHPLIIFKKKLHKWLVNQCFYSIEEYLNFNHICIE